MAPSSSTRSSPPMQMASQMASYRVSLAGVSDVEAVYELLASAGRHLAAQGYRNWETPYLRSCIEADIAGGVLFLVCPRDSAALLPDAKPVATYTLRREPVRVYDPVPWAVPEAPARYLNRLAVNPELQGRGVGGWCLSYIAEVAAREEARAIRCDVLEANAGLRRFYEAAGYHARGTRRHSGWEFVSYERLIGAATGGDQNTPGT